MKTAVLGVILVLAMLVSAAPASAQVTAAPQALTSVAQTPGPRLTDSSRDGALKGLALGAAAGAGSIVLLYAVMGDDVEAPAMGGPLLAGTAVGAGAGAAIGYLIDRANRSASPGANKDGKVTIAPVVGRKIRSVRLTLRF